jgi:phage tail-like protein
VALSSSDIRTTYPLPVYNFRVEIGTDTVAFAAVSGLSIAYGTTTYQESPTANGQPGPVTMIMPAQSQTTTLTLTKGVVPLVSVKALYSWIAQVRVNQVEKKDVTIRLCDEKGDPVISWIVQNAFPTKLDAPAFDVTSNDVAIETLELTADGVVIDEAA